MKIEKKIPLPPSRKHHAGRSALLNSMYVGDSIMLDGQTTAEIASMRVLASSIAKGSDKKFTTRKVEGGYRMWRTQ